MKKSTGIALISLLVSIIGVLIALAAYFKNHQRDTWNDYLYDEDDFYNDDYDFDADCDCDCDHDCSCTPDEFQNANIDFAPEPQKKEENKQ